MTALVYFNDSMSTSGTSNSVLVNAPFITLKIDPEVADAHLNDTVMYSIIVSNTGTSPAYNVVLNASLFNLTLVNISTGNLNWSYTKMNVSEVKTETINVTVAACDNQFMNVTVSRSCNKTVCQSTFVKGSIRFIPRIPYVIIEVKNVLVNYCQKTVVQVNLSNTGDSGAYNFYLAMPGLPSQYVSNPNATFYPGNSTFYINAIPPNGSFNLTFDFGMSYGNCTPPGSGTVAIIPTYYDECRNLWAPPVHLFSYAFNASSSPSLSAAKTANRTSLYFGEEVQFNLTAGYNKGLCPNDSVNVTIIDQYHEKLAIVNAGDGAVDASNRTIIWNNVPLQDGASWNRTLTFRANVTCSCGQSLTNTLTVIGGTDCCGCPLNASASDSVIVECYNTTFFTSSKTAFPDPQEVCKNVSYNTTYHFTETLNWSEMWFMEVGNNNQTFPDGTMSGTAAFYVNGTMCNESTITLGQWFNLGSLNLSSCAGADKIYPGTTLEIKYTLKQTTDGSFPDWSYLNVTGYTNSDCLGLGYYTEMVTVNAQRPALSITVDITELINVCEEYNVTITASKSGDFLVYNVTIYYDDALYRYIDNTTNLSGFKNESGSPISSFEPARNGTILSWYLGNLSSGGTIRFKALKNCSLASTAMAWLDYQDNCDLAPPVNIRRSDDSDQPLILTTGDIIILKTPKVVFARTRNVSWNIYVTNKGNGTAKNVTVVDVLDPDLLYVSSSIDGTARPNETNATGNTVTWTLGDVVPNRKVTIGLNATFAGCQWLNNTVNASWGCCNETCQAVRDVSQVEILKGVAVFIRHDADLIDECGGTANFTIIAKNVGESYVYDARAIEILPECLEFVPGTNSSSPNATAFTYYAANRTLIWYYDALAPGNTVNLGFKVVINQSCVCNASFGEAVAKMNYTIPCGDFGQEDVKPFEPVKAAPHLSITKTPPFTIAENSSIVNWTITITSDGDYEAKNITLQDVLPNNTVFVSTDVPGYTGTGTSNDPLVWYLANMSVGNVTRLNVSARVSSCSATDTENNATVFWGCCPPKESASAVAQLRTQPVLVLDKTYALDTCGGNITLTIKNEGSTATIINITEYLPAGYDYLANSANISNNNLSHLITNFEPGIVNPAYIQWNATNVDRIYPNETLAIGFIVNNTDCTSPYCEKVYHTNETLVINYTDSCANLFTKNQTWTVSPTIIEIRVHKEPPTQVVGIASWTINISSYNATAYNVTVEDVLGTAFHSINAEGSPTISTLPDGTKKVLWTGQTVPKGVDKWVQRVTAQVNESGTVNNNVTVFGSCLCGCIYSMHGDLVYASRLNFTKKPNETLTIGEYANFTIAAEYWGPENYSTVMITDALPQNLTYISSNITDNGGVSYNDNLTKSYNGTTKITYLMWILGNFTGPKIFTINLTTVVNDTIGNQNGTVIWNNAYSVHKNDYNDTFQAYDSAWVRVVEPDLLINKSTDRTTVVVAGDVVLYTLKGYHTNQSAHDAYDVWINDTVPNKLEILSNTSTPAADSVIRTGNNFSWFYRYVPLSYNYSNPINITYTVKVNDSVIIGEILRNNATLTWTSVNGTTGNESHERYGGWNNLDDYNRTNVTTLNVSTSVSMEKLPTGTSNRTIGERVNFTIKVYLPKTLVLDVWVNDTLSTGLIYDNTTLTIVANNETFKETTSVPNNGTTSTTVRWYLGNVSNADGKNITINFTAIVADVLYNQNGTKVNNTATFSWKYANGSRGSLTPKKSGDIIIYEPDLNVTKQFNVSKVEAGDIINFTIFVNHTAQSAWDAYDLWINDTIPAKLAPISCSPNPTVDHSWYFPRLNRSNNITITCTAQVTDAVLLNETLRNIVNLTWTSTNGTNPYERFGNWTPLDNYNRTATANITANATFSISKKVDRPNATIGEYVNYTLQVNVSRGHALNLTVKDTLQKGLIYYANTTSVPPDNFTVSSPNNGTQNVTVTFVYYDFNNSAGNNLTIMLTAIVADVQGNLNNTRLNDTLNVTWKDATNVTRSSETTVSIGLFEPDLQITKQFNVSRVEAGDVINFTIFVNHTNKSAWDAYDLWINDTIPAKLEDVNCSATPLPDQTTDHSWYYARLNRSNNITITCTARVTGAIVLNETLRNIVNLTWTSTNGTNPYERFGNWTPLDDYNQTTSANVTANTTFSISKKVDRNNATIGEYVNYTLRVNVSRGHALNLTVKDTLQQGLIYFANVTSVEPDNVTNSTPNDGSAPVTVTFVYYDFNNSAGNNLTIILTAIVADVQGNQNGTRLNDTLNVTWKDATNVTRTNETTVSISLFEPDLQIAKQFNVSKVEAGDIINFTIFVNHTAQSAWDAYDLWINDTIPAKLEPISCSSTPAPDQTTDHSWYYARLNRSNNITIICTARVTGAVVLNETLRNIVNLTWTSVNASFGNESHERFGNYTQLDDYNRTDSTVLTGETNWTLNKTVDKATATIGEYVNYTLRVYLPKVHVLNLTITDSLQQGLIYHDNTSSVNPDNFTVSSPNDGSQDVTVTFGYNDFNNSLGTNLTVNLTAIVANVQDNQNGTRLNNTLNFSWTDAQDVKHTNETNVSITVAEPDLAINKTTNVSHVHVEAGDLITFNITINHTQNSTADAYDVWVNDTIPIRTELVDNSSNPPADTFSRVDRDLSWFYEYVPRGQIINITYIVRVNESVSPLDILINNVTLTWTSVNETVGNESHERFGGWNTLNDYNDSDSQQVIVLAAELYKAPDFNRSYWINDSVWYRISLVLPYSTVLNATVNDTLPRGLIFENTSVKVVPNHTYNLTFSTPNDGTLPVDITFDFGTFQDGKIINITFNATVADIPANKNGTILGQNFAELFWKDNEGIPHNASDTSGNITVIRLPRITTTDDVIKIVEPDYVLPGAIVNYTVYIKNDGFAPAFNVTLSDILPQYVSYINTTTIVQGLPGPDPDNITPYGNGTKLMWTNLITRLNASETIWVQYSCWVSPNAPFGAILLNNATVEKFEDDEGNEYKGASDSAIIGSPLPVPELTPTGMIALVGLLSITMALRLRLKKRLSTGSLKY